MKRISLILFIILCCLSSSSYSESSTQFLNKVRASGIVAENESVLLSSNVYFYPNKKGHAIFSGGKDREKGYIVFTENGFSVISWSRRSKSYELLHQELYSDLASTDIAGNSPMLRLVTETKATGKYNSYEIMDSRNALTPNVVKTKEANKIVAAGIEGLDVKQIATAKEISVAEAALQQQRLEALEARIQKLEEEGNQVNKAAIDKECDCKCEQ